MERGREELGGSRRVPARAFGARRRSREVVLTEDEGGSRGAAGATTIQANACNLESAPPNGWHVSRNWGVLDGRLGVKVPRSSTLPKQQEQCLDAARAAGGKGGAKRHPSAARNIQGIGEAGDPPPGSPWRCQAHQRLIYEETRRVLKVFLENVIRDAVTSGARAPEDGDGDGRRLRAQATGRTLYGVGGSSTLPTNSNRRTSQPPPLSALHQAVRAPQETRSIMPNHKRSPATAHANDGRGRRVGEGERHGDSSRLTILRLPCYAREIRWSVVLGLRVGGSRGAYARSPRMRRASWMSFGMIVTRLAWIAHRLVSSKRPTRYASEPPGGRRPPTTGSGGPS